ncbi:MAG: acetyl-CoA carboxylase carboxyltransferase subunit beta [Syntrophaceae bacterium]
MSDVLEIAKKDGRWTECPACKETIITGKLKENLHVCPHCDFHLRIGARERLTITCDAQGLIELDSKTLTLGNQAGGEDAIMGALGSILGERCVVGAMDFGFKGGSMGTAMGQAIIALIQHARQVSWPLVFFCASGGVRVQEGIWGLMQMLKTVHALNDTDIPLITVYTDPTYGGVTASFSALADIILAEPGARIGFAGPRVIKETSHIELPADFQNALRLQTHGFLDMVVHRHAMRDTLGYILKWISSGLNPQAAHPQDGA